jgi:serine/threonine protein kinase
MKIMSHPLLVQYKNCIQTKTHLYIVTELCPGKDLYEFVMERKHLTEKDAALIIQQIIVGIRYMNSLGLLHRDLKPENIMVLSLSSSRSTLTQRQIKFKL